MIAPRPAQPRSIGIRLSHIDPESHYGGNLAPIEHTDLPECAVAIQNIGWTLGNECPYRCKHCYSMSARRKGLNLERWMIDRIVSELMELHVKTVNLGGNEPIFTNGLDARQSLLPYIIEKLAETGIHVGLTTSGITLLKLRELRPDVIGLLNDIDISLDSPDPEEHNQNRGAVLFGKALEALDICQEYGIDHTIIMCAMTWNFTCAHIDALIEIARRYDAYIRINLLKPVESSHLGVVPDVHMFYEGFSHLMATCEQIDLGEPLLATVAGHPGLGCPCGRTSFRIHSITPTGEIPVSPCVYLHDFKVGNLLVDDLYSIVHSPSFQSFRRRNANPQIIDGCDGCSFIATCRGGCAARSYLHHLHEQARRSLFVRDPYCLRDYLREQGNLLPKFSRAPMLPPDKILVHRDYLCTWIGKPR